MMMNYNTISINLPEISKCKTGICTLISNNIFLQENFLLTILGILLILIVITALAFLLTKLFRNVEKGGGSMPVTFYGATDAFMDTDKRKAAETIVEERAGKKMEEQSSEEPKNDMSEFWDNIYQANEYVYGKEPNEFFKEFIDKTIPGKILLPADGEGRNSVYAALKGWKVYAFDFSRSAVKKALELASSKNAEVNFYIEDLKNLDSYKDSYDLIALIFIHLAPDLRKLVHRNVTRLLKTGGTIILEAFSKKQIYNDTEGPKNLELLYSKEEIKKDFNLLEIEYLDNVVRNLNEGYFHKGKSNIIRMVAHKITS